MNTYPNNYFMTLNNNQYQILPTNDNKKFAKLSKNIPLVLSRKVEHNILKTNFRNLF